LFVGGDVSFNSRLTVISDVSFNNRLFVGGDVSFNSRLTVIRDVSFNNRLFVGGDVSFNSRLTVISDVSFNNRLFVGGDTSLNGNLHVNNYSKVNHITEYINTITYAAIITVPYLKDFYYIASPTANFTIDFTGFPIDANQAFFCTLYINTGTNRFFCNAVRINGVARTLLYAGGIAGATLGTTCTFAMQTFNFVNAGGSAPIAIITNLYPYQ
jgi:hypothetical protein